MKKVLLSSVVALAVFTAASPVFAIQGNSNDADTTFNPFTEDGNLSDQAKAGVDSQLKDKTSDNFKKSGQKVEPKKDKDGKVIPNEFVVSGKPKAKAPAAGQKALPKTSAVK